MLKIIQSSYGVFMVILIYKFINIFFLVFHTALTLFNIFGWIFRRTRFLNLITLSFTAFSWFIMGIWYGWGYCFLTDWHWKVRELLHYRDVSDSYIQFLLLQYTGINFPENMVIIITLIIFLFSFTMSIIFNIIDFIKAMKLKT